MKFFKNILNGILSSFDTKPGGYSSRKLTAFIAVMCIIYIHIKFIGQTNAVDALLYDMGFVLVLLGIVTVDKLYQFKLGKNTPGIKPQESEESEKHPSDEEKIEPEKIES